jgi:hypothetical protein
MFIKLLILIISLSETLEDLLIFTLSLLFYSLVSLIFYQSNMLVIVPRVMPYIK